MRDRLNRLLEAATYKQTYTNSDGEPVASVRKRIVDINEAKILADHLLANGVIVPPCVVGQKVYCLEHKSIYEATVIEVKSLTDEANTKFFVKTECEIEDPFYADGRKMKHGISAVWEIEWGSWHRAFPTKKEAEEALAERNKNEISSRR